MCDPLTLTVIAVAGTVLTAGAQVYQGAQARQQGQFEQQVAQRNAKLEEAQTTDAWNRRNTEQMRLWRAVTARLSDERADAAASGLDVNFGSPSEQQSDILLIGMEDSSTLNENYIKEVKGYDINASNYRLRGEAARMAGEGAYFGSLLSAGGTLLSGASQVGKINFGPKTP